MVYPAGHPFASASSNTAGQVQFHSDDEKKSSTSSTPALCAVQGGSVGTHTPPGPSAKKFQVELQASRVSPGSDELIDKEFEKSVRSKFQEVDANHLIKDYHRLDAHEDQSVRQSLKRRLLFFINQSQERQDGIFSLSSFRTTVQPEQKITFEDVDVHDMMRSFGLEEMEMAKGLTRLDQIFGDFYDAINLSYIGVHPGPEPYQSEKYETLPKDQWESRFCAQDSSPEIRDAVKDLREASETLHFDLHVSKDDGSAQGIDVLLNFFGAEPGYEKDQTQLDAVFGNKNGPLEASYQKMNSALDCLFNGSSQPDASLRLKGICGFSLGALPGVGAKIGLNQLQHVPLLLLDPVPQNTPLANMFAGEENLEKFARLHGVAIVLNNPRDPALCLFQFMEKLGFKYPGLFVINKLLKEDDSKGYKSGEKVAGAPQPNLIFGYHGRKENMQMYANTILMIRDALKEKLRQLADTGDRV